MSAPRPFPGSRDQARKHLMLGLEAHQRGRLDEAERRYQAAAAADPDLADAQHLLGVLRLQAGDCAAAERLIRGAIEREPRAEFWSNLSGALMGLSRHDDAAEACRKAIQLNPELADAWYNLGNAELERRRWSEAVAAYRMALQLRADWAACWNNLGSALLELNRIAEATEAIDEALRLEPAQAKAWNNRALALTVQGRLEVAEEAYRRALALEPRYPKALSGLATLLQATGRLDEAMSLAQAAIRLQPDAAEAYNTMGNVLAGCAEIREAISCFEKASALAPDDPCLASNALFHRLYLSSTTQADLLEASKAWAERFALRPLPPARREPEETRRPRIGFVSGDLRRHPVGYFLLPLLENWDAERAEVVLYSNHNEQDDLSARLRSLAGGWRNIHPLTPAQAAEMVREDGIDLLVDLSGHTAHHSLQLFSLRPAPVQASWLGYPATTGLDAIDYLIADSTTVPPEDEPFYTERIARLPECFACLGVPPEARETERPPALGRDGFRFGCFNNPAKLSDETVAVWSEILTALPHSQLVLKSLPFRSPRVAEWFAARFLRHGVSVEQLQILGPTDRRTHFALYTSIDLALDPFPYGGATTTAESLLMGVPVLTLRGDRYAGRCSESFLRSVGLGELVARDRSEYVRLAIELARNDGRLAGLRDHLCERAASSPMADGARFARSFQDLCEALLRQGARRAVA
ncbi:MAG: tetratricopeptide repeat protein [Fimbriimonadales bacterium]|nr:tetratricopeptide repeat protein [Fimbriimonadales bacterium]